jgi:hypothetical protein
MKGMVAILVALAAVLVGCEREPSGTPAFASKIVDVTRAGCFMSQGKAVKNTSTTRQLTAVVKTVSAGSGGPYCNSSEDTKDHPLSPNASEFLGCSRNIPNPQDPCVYNYTYSVVGEY